MQTRSINAVLKTYISVILAHPKWSCSHLLSAIRIWKMEGMRTLTGRSRSRTTLSRPLRCSITIRLMMLWSKSIWPCSRTSKRSWKVQMYTSSKHSHKSLNICKLLSKFLIYNNSTKRIQTVFSASKTTPLSKKSSSNRKRSKKLLIRKTRRQRKSLLRMEPQRWWAKAVRISNQKTILIKLRLPSQEKSQMMD